MSNQKKRTKSIISILGCFVIFTVFFFTEKVNASYTSVSLSPSSGTITNENSKIDLVVNSGTDNFIGIDLDVSFTGTVSFVQGTGSGCTFTPKTGAVNVECFNFEEQPYNGLVASLYFIATQQGQTVFTLTNVDPEVTNIGSGQYTLTLTGAGTNPPTVLPATGVLDKVIVKMLFGATLLIFGLLLSFVSSQNRTVIIETFEKKLLEKRI